MINLDVMEQFDRMRRRTEYISQAEVIGDDLIIHWQSDSDTDALRRLRQSSEPQNPNDLHWGGEPYTIVKDRFAFFRKKTVDIGIDEHGEVVADVEIERFIDCDFANLTRRTLVEVFEPAPPKGESHGDDGG